MDELELQKAVNICYHMCDFISKRSRADVSILLKSMQYDILKYCTYICRHEGDIPQEKITVINKILNSSYSKATMLCFAVDMQTTGTIGFEFKVPQTFRTFVMDDMLGNDPKYNNAKATYLYMVYLNIGNLLVNMDKKPIKECVTLKNDYCNMLEQFLREKTVYTSPTFTFNEEPTYIPPAQPTQIPQPATSTPQTQVQGQQEEIEEPEDPRTMEELMEELNSLTGLEGVKKEIQALTNLIKINKLREEKGLKPSNVSKHMVFAGNPGTGKTTVARLLAKIYKKLGVLSKGHLVETDRSGLVAGYVGQTAIKSQEVISKAIGGELFIDEAYTLSANKGEGDFGQEAIDTLLKMMEDNRDDLVVVVAGYPDLMDEFLCSNPGLKSRFTKVIEFDDYTSDELNDILYGMCERQDFVIAEDAAEDVKKLLDKMLEEKDEDFANARSIRNLLEEAIRRQADRLITIEDCTVDDLTTLTASDFNIVEKTVENVEDETEEDNK